LKQSAFTCALLLAAGIAAISSPTNAQDASPFPGPYVGVHGGYAWQGVRGAFDNLGSHTNLSGLDMDRGIMGAQLGYNIERNHIVLGIEADASSYVGSSGSLINPDPPLHQQLSADVAYLGSVRGRIGYVIDDVLAYGALGIGFTEFKFSENAPATPFMGSMRLQETGLVYGGGLEWNIAYGVSVRTEYLHYDVGGLAYIPASFPNSDSGDYVKFNDIDVVRAGLNIRLGQ
jgi:outer membrane immunogenic protein